MKRPDDASLLNRVRADYYLQFLNTDKDQASDPYMMRYAAAGENVTTELGWRTLRAHYLANVTLVDGMVGRIIYRINFSIYMDNIVVVKAAHNLDNEVCFADI